MKRKTLTGLFVAGLLMSGATMTLFAQNGPGPNGRGYGGPPQSQEERAARQAACLERNGGVCPNGGPQASGQGRGMRQGQGRGYGWGRGMRDGTGPRSANGTCPMNSPAQQQK